MLKPHLTPDKLQLTIEPIFVFISSIDELNPQITCIYDPNIGAIDQHKIVSRICHRFIKIKHHVKFRSRVNIHKYPINGLLSKGCQCTFNSKPGNSFLMLIHNMNTNLIVRIHLNYEPTIKETISNIIKSIETNSPLLDEKIHKPFDTLFIKYSQITTTTGLKKVNQAYNYIHLFDPNIEIDHSLKKLMLKLRDKNLDKQILINYKRTNN